MNHNRSPRCKSTRWSKLSRQFTRAYPCGPQRTGGMIRPLLLVLASGVLIGVVIWMMQASSEDPVARRAVVLAYEANGALENEQYSVGTGPDGQLIFGFTEAVARYEELIKLFPDEELPRRNLAIARIALLLNQAANAESGEGASPMPTEQDVREKAVSAVETLVEKHDNAVTSYLYGMLLKNVGGQRALQVEMTRKFHEAAKREPDHAPFWQIAAESSDQLLVSSNQDESVLRPIYEEAMTELRRLVPDNLWVVRWTLKQMAEAQSPELLNYWISKRPLLEKANFASRNYRGTESLGGDFEEVFNEFEQAVKDGDRRRSVELAFLLESGMRGKMPCVNDLSEIQPNALDYLLWHFSDTIMARAYQGWLEPNANIPIEFTSRVLPVTTPDTVALDFSVADLDLDGQLDLFVLQAGEVRVFQGPLHNLGAEPMLTVPVAPDATGVLASFLLTIADGGGSGVKQRLMRSRNQTESDPAHIELPQILAWGPQGLEFFSVDWSAETGFVPTKLEQPEEIQAAMDIRKCHLVDFDQDADLDVIALTNTGVKLLMNRGNNTFVDATQWSNLPPSTFVPVDVQICDWNRDLYIDLLLQSEDGSVGMLANQRHGAFTFKLLDTPCSPTSSGMSVGELDGNASWDLIAQVGENAEVHFTETMAWSKTEWLSRSVDADLTAASTSIKGQLFGPWQIGDFDNSSSQDFLLWNEGELQFHAGLWTGPGMTRGARRIRWEPTTTRVSLPSEPTIGERLDFDGDGDLDVLVLAGGQVILLDNEGGNANRWVTLIPQGTGDNFSRTNHLGIGSLVETRVGDRYYAETVTRPSVHVGLGTAERANLARVVWTNGIPQVLLLPPGQQKVEMLCILKGSCPFIYVWNGEKWEFFSDCLWAAPIGLQSPAGGVVPTRNWEYLRLPPGSLQPSEGTYRVMLTEELWEIAYFDEARLWVIDHPESVEIQINDKVGPPQIVQHRLYAVKDKLGLQRAVDQRGRDVTVALSREDQQYARAFDYRVTQGYVEPHEYELDFGGKSLESSTLFLTGWIQPTDTSLNVMLQQNPDLPGPQFPQLSVIGLDGEWQPVARPMGFPGGKTKTMAVPLDGIFPTDDHRIRLSTSAEIYWDHIYVAQTEDNLQLTEVEAKLVKSRSFHRGTSRRDPPVENGPETFDAEDVSFAAIWPPVQGAFTPYGDVLERMQSADDQLVVLGTGDAVELQFKVPSQPTPPGYARTFLLYTVGYDKDSDLHTLAGQSVEPLPFASMAAYPAPPQTSSDRKDLGTMPAVGRQQSWHRFWKQIQNPYGHIPADESKVPRGGQYQRLSR